MLQSQLKNRKAMCACTSLMLRNADLALIFFILFFAAADIHAQELNFDPDEELYIGSDSVNLRALDYSACTEIKTVYPKIRIFVKRTVKIQECFIGPERAEKLIIITYYDSGKNIKTPIGFVFAIQQNEELRVIWGKVDDGFVLTGCANRAWRTLVSTQELSVDEQVITLLLMGFKKDCKNYNDTNSHAVAQSMPGQI